LINRSILYSPPKTVILSTASQTSMLAELDASELDRNSYRPVFFRLPADEAPLQELLKRRPWIRVIDGLHAQLGELVRTLHPDRRFTAEELAEAAKAHVGDTPSAHYGVWVYYPWNDNLVHLLDEAEFVRVRTDRNRDKITREEQAVLATKKVGVVGLSVGQSVSMAMALERSFGEIRLADFDTLELSNLNRIRSGVHEMGTPKVINTAREIAELDPYLHVKVFTDGLTQENMDRFLTEGGPLDVLVDECDSTDIKILARLKAREQRIPVVMDTSDRGLVDVERFDLEPDRPIMHGFLEHLDLSVAVKGMTPAQKYDYIMAMVDLGSLSERMKASLPQVGRTLVTWPQLGGHVTLGGALAGELCRKIFLNMHIPSGRWYVDLDELLTAKASRIPQHTRTRPTII
jgi:molybdopterin/thiamine biosynthesis adenylyltransferase